MRAVVSVVPAVLAIALVHGAEPAPPPDFKVRVENFGPRREPVCRAELLVRQGRAYWLLSGSNEVIVYDPAVGQVKLLDLERMERTALLLNRLDQALGRWRQGKLAAVAALERAGGRANTLSAATGRELVDPQLSVTFDAAANRLRMTNASVDVDAVGEPEPDRARRAFEADALAWFLKLETIRNDAGALPPFAALDALHELTARHTLRPRAIDFLYRVAGTPHKVRWTYRLTPGLSEAESGAVARLDRALAQARFVPFADYEEEDDPTP
jgi:hypothetical protein